MLPYVAINCSCNNINIIFSKEIDDYIACRFLKTSNVFGSDEEICDASTCSWSVTTSQSAISNKHPTASN